MAMDDYATEEQRVEALRDWWRQNATSILAGVVLALAGILGWQWWQQRQSGTSEQASLVYDGVLAALAKKDAEQVRTRGQALISEKPDSAYAALAALAMARSALDGGDVAAALASLDWAAQHAPSPELVSVANLRAARLLIAEKRFDEAAQRLDKVGGSGLAPEREELRGDLAFARGDLKAARSAWQAALAAAGPENGVLIQLKLDNLPAEEPK